MKSKITLEEVKKAIFFPFKGEKWGIKLLIGSALGFANFIIPLVPVIPMYGYYMRMMRQVIVEEKDPQMPEWNDWGGLFLDGLKLFGAMALYMLPAVLLIIAGYALFFVPYFTTMMSAVNTNTSNLDPTMFLGSMLAMFTGMPVMMLGIVLAFGTSLLIPPAIVNMVVKGDFMAAFRFREWWPVLKINLTGFLLSLAFTLGLFYLTYFGVMLVYMTVILCFLLPFLMVFVGFFTGLSGMSLFSIAYRDGLHMLTGKK